MIFPPPYSSSTDPRVSRLGYLGLVFFVLGILAVHFDVAIVTFTNGTHLKGDVRRVIDLAEAFSFGPAAIVIALGVVLADSRSKRLTLRLFAYPILAGLSANLFKLAVPRLRPRGLESFETLQGYAANGWETFAVPLSDYAKTAGDGSSSVWQSFPSGHTATAIGLAIGLTRLYPQARWYFFSLALFAGLQRIFSNSHYPGDVLAGAGLAMLVCWVFEQKSVWSLAIATRSYGASNEALPSIHRAA